MHGWWFKPPEEANADFNYLDKRWTKKSKMEGWHGTNGLSVEALYTAFLSSMVYHIIRALIFSFFMVDRRYI